MSSQTLFIISFEPNSNLTLPYLHFPLAYHFYTRRSLSVQPLKKIAAPPSLVTISTSYPIEEIVDFLWELKNVYIDQIIPLIFMVDWSQPLTQIPGTSWGNKVGILHSLSSAAEVQSTLTRLMGKKEGRL